MTYLFWAKCFFSVFVMVGCAYIVTERESKERESFLATTDLEKDPPKYNATSNVDVDYHISEEELRKQERHNLNAVYIIGENGRPVAVNMETTQSFPTFYSPGTFPFGAAAYVPTYEDAVMMPLARQKKY